MDWIKKPEDLKQDRKIYNYSIALPHMITKHKIKSMILKITVFLSFIVNYSCRYHDQRKAESWIVNQKSGLTRLLYHALNSAVGISM